jgi:hypothetical protein
MSVRERIAAKNAQVALAYMSGTEVQIPRPARIKLKIAKRFPHAVAEDVRCIGDSALACMSL